MSLCCAGMGGGDADTVVSAYTCLDNECMRFASFAYLQRKSDAVNKYTIIDTITVRKSCLCAVLLCWQLETNNYQLSRC